MSSCIALSQPGPTCLRVGYRAAVAAGGGGDDSAICRCRAYFNDRVAAAVGAAGVAGLAGLCAAAAGRLQLLHFAVENGAALQVRTRARTQTQTQT